MTEQRYTIYANACEQIRQYSKEQHCTLQDSAIDYINEGPIDDWLKRHIRAEFNI